MEVLSFVKLLTGYLTKIQLNIRVYTHNRTSLYLTRSTYGTGTNVWEKFDFN